MNYKLFSEKLKLEVAGFKANNSALFSYARLLGIKVSGIFEVEPVCFSDDVPVSNVRFSNSEFELDDDAFETLEELKARNAILDVLWNLREEFSERFFLYILNCFFINRLMLLVDI